MQVCENLKRKFTFEFISAPLTAVTGVLVGTVAAIVVAVARPHSRDASAVSAGKLA